MIAVLNTFDLSTHKGRGSVLRRRSLYFFPDRSGITDLWVSTRARLEDVDDGDDDG